MKVVVRQISDKKPEVILWERLLKKWMSKTIIKQTDAALFSTSCDAPFINNNSIQQ